MPAISQLNTNIPSQKVHFKGAETQYNYQAGKIDNMAFFQELDSFEKDSSGTKKKVLLGALALVVVGAILHKMPVEKLPKFLAPVKDFVGKIVAKISGKGDDLAKGVAKSGDDVVKATSRATGVAARLTAGGTGGLLGAGLNISSRFKFIIIGLVRFVSLKNGIPFVMNLPFSSTTFSRETPIKPLSIRNSE